MLRGVRPQIAQELLLEIVLQYRPELSGTPVAKAKLGRYIGEFDTASYRHRYRVYRAAGSAGP